MPGKGVNTPDSLGTEVRPDDVIYPEYLKKIGGLDQTLWELPHGRGVKDRLVRVQVTVDTCGYLIPGIGEWYVDGLDSKTSQPKSATQGERPKTTARGKFLK